MIRVESCRILEKHKLLFEMAVKVFSAILCVLNHLTMLNSVYNFDLSVSVVVCTHIFYKYYKSNLKYACAIKLYCSMLGLEKYVYIIHTLCTRTLKRIQKNNY